MPDYVLADEFRELTGIPIAPFVPLEQRPTNALYPAAREALKDPDQLKVLNEILQKEWQSRCALVNINLPHNTRDRNTDKTLRDAGANWKYTTSQLDMLKLDVSRYDVSRLHVDPGRKAKADNHPVMFLDGFVADEGNVKTAASLAVSKGDRKHILRFHRTSYGVGDETRSRSQASSSVKHSLILGSHTFPTVDEEVQTKGPKAFPNAGTKCPQFTSMVAFFFVELYFFATGLREDEIKKTKYKPEPASKGRKNASRNATAGTYPTDFLERIWNSYDTQGDQFWYENGEHKLRTAWAHAYGQPIDQAPGWDEFKALAKKLKGSGRTRVSEIASWVRSDSVPPAHTAGHSTPNHTAAHSNHGAAQHPLSASASNANPDDVHPAAGIYSALEHKTNVERQDTLDEFSRIQYPSAEVMRTPQFQELQRRVFAIIDEYI